MVVVVAVSAMPVSLVRSLWTSPAAVVRPNAPPVAASCPPLCWILAYPLLLALVSNPSRHPIIRFLTAALEL